MHEPHFGAHASSVSAGGEALPSFKGNAFQDAKHDVLARFEREYFAVLFEEAKANISEIARRAGMERAHVRTYLKRHGITTTKAKDGPNRRSHGPRLAASPR